MGNFDRGERRGESRGPRSFGGSSGPRGSGGPRNDFGPREMHKATCSECGQECQVPFKPREGKPVYCRECYASKRQF